MNLAENLLPLGFPDVARWMSVPFAQVGQNLVAEFLDVCKTTLPHDVDGKVPEEAFNQVHPRCRCWREMHVKSLVLGQPLLDVAVLVRGIIVGNQMELDPCG